MWKGVCVFKKCLTGEWKRLDLWKFGIALYVKRSMRDTLVSYIKYKEKQV